MYKLYIRKNIDSKTLLNEILKKENINKYELIYNEYGKPYLKDNKLFFNISHSKDIIVIAISDKEIGIDIQHITYKVNALYKSYTEEEIKLVGNDKYLFTEMWVMKEAYVKMLGKGLSYGLKNVNTIKLANRFNIIGEEDYLIAIIEKDNV